MIPPAIHSLSFIGSDRKLLLVGFNCDRVMVRHKVDLLAAGSEKYMAENKHKCISIKKSSTKIKHNIEV